MANARYVSNGEMIAGTSDEATMYDLDGAAQSLLRKMRTNGTFKRNYAALMDAKKGLPLVAIGRIEDRTGGASEECADVQARLDSVRNEVCISVFESELFTVRDDMLSETVSKRILKNSKNGLEDGALAEVLNKHPSPDCVMVGDLRKFSDRGGYYVYRLHLSLQDLKSGTVMWEGAETVIKL